MSCSYRLFDVLATTLAVVCDRRSRRGRYRVDTVIDGYTADAGVPNVLARISMGIPLTQYLIGDHRQVDMLAC